MDELKQNIPAEPTPDAQASGPASIPQAADLAAGAAAQPVPEPEAVKAASAEAPADAAEAAETELEQAEADEAAAEQASAAAAADAPAQAAAGKLLVTVADVRFRNNAKSYFFDPGELALNAGDHVIIDTARGTEFGVCAMGNHAVPSSEVVPPLRRVLRMATAQDERVNAQNEEREKRAFAVCQQKIADRGLEMQLVSAECAFDGSKILFFFTADGRVDFRELVKDLATAFRTRIELRQIGVRDKAKMVGGLGVCGRPFCCREFLDDFAPVSIKMAKTQNLSLNPTKISGVCGRLMCCLKYEQEAYEDLLKTAPKNESFVDTPDGRGTVTEVNLLRQCVKVRMEDHPETIGCYHNCDICVLRSGKARKNDPPIPKDLAPISSKPRKPAPQEEEEELMPELIYSDMSSEPLLESTPLHITEADTAEKPRRRRRGRGRGKGSAGAAPDAAAQKPVGDRPTQKEKPVPKPRAERPAGDTPADGKPANPSRRRRSRGRRGGGGGNSGANAAPKAE